MIETTLPVSPWPRVATSQRDAFDRAYAQLYPDLCRIARARLRRSAQRDLDSHSLVHECFLRLVGAAPPLEDMRHFCAYVAKTMQNIAIDIVREQEADRRGGGFETISLDADGGEPVPEGPATGDQARSRTFTTLCLPSKPPTRRCHDSCGCATSTATASARSPQ